VRVQWSEVEARGVLKAGGAPGCRCRGSRRSAGSFDRTSAVVRLAGYICAEPVRVLRPRECNRPFIRAHKRRSLKRASAHMTLDSRRNDSSEAGRVNSSASSSPGTCRTPKHHCRHRRDAKCNHIWPAPGPTHRSYRRRIAFLGGRQRHSSLPRPRSSAHNAEACYTSPR
jgi:hypothetical protein